MAVVAYLLESSDSFWDVRESRADMASQTAEFFCGAIFKVMLRLSWQPSQGIHSVGESLELCPRENYNATIVSQEGFAGNNF